MKNNAYHILSIILIFQFNLFGQEISESDSCSRVYNYQIGLDYGDVYIQIDRSTEPITLESDSALVEFDINTLSGQSLIGKYDTIFIQGGKKNIKYYVFDSLTNSIEGYIDFYGYNRIWIKKDKGRYDYGPLVFMPGFDNYHKPSSFTNIPVKITFIVSHFYGYAMRYANDNLGVSCKKALTSSQLNEIRNDFNFSGTVKPIYIYEYGCCCKTYTTGIDPIIIE